MSQIIDKNKYIHFIGIGGINMSSLAEIMLSHGYLVSGSDSKESELTQKLAGLGARIHIGQCAENISSEVGLVVYTAAIRETNPELKAAREMGIECETRAWFLGQIMKNYKNVICISGTHGKTTTTSLISQIFLNENLDPTIMAGGILPSIGSNTRIGGSDSLIAEACEYTNSFLSFFPTIAVILNVKADHLDFFKDIDDIRASFKKFTRLIPDDGALVINGEIENLPYFTDGLKCRIYTYGFDSKYDFYAENVSFNDHACGEYDLYMSGRFLGHVQLSITGMHNVSNSIAAVTASYAAGVDISSAISAFSAFQGVKRRFEVKGTFNGVTVIDDYAHHPDEIRATLSAAALYPHKKLWVVFQPHTYSRTIALMDDFVKALSAADAVVLTEIYAARETNEFGVSSDDISKKLIAAGNESYYLPTFEEAENFLKKNCSAGDVLITMGAGDVVNIAENLV